MLGLSLLSGVTTADPNRSLFKGYQSLLASYVIEQRLPGGGLVSAFDYLAALNDNATPQLLARQRTLLQEFDPRTLDGREESVAFWINAYNFFMVFQILTERPGDELVSSVWDYGGRLNPFVDNVFERERFSVGGRDYSLDGIEKGILLGEEYADKGWKDARVHFAVNCASVGCPPLRAQLYTADNLEQLLEENTRLAFNTPRHLRVSGDTLYLTELFKWYEEDFRQAAGSAKAFISKWATVEIAALVKGSAAVDSISYDWALNRPENFPELE
ncbi:hypothetical protein Q667_16145 [Marinobacter sp. C1S70]|nr:hypothetical protein Q667_16145 [Marinobacter sp. C1S70]